MNPSEDQPVICGTSGEAVVQSLAAVALVSPGPVAAPAAPVRPQSGWYAAAHRRGPQRGRMRSLQVSRVESTACSSPTVRQVAEAATLG